MSLKEQLFVDLKESMKTKDTVRKNTVQSVRAAILQEEKDNKVELDDQGVIKVVVSQLKKRKSSLPDFEKSGREDLITELKTEIEVLQGYLPEQMSEEEVIKVIEQVIADLEATTMKDMGKVMGVLSSKLQGKADNSIVSGIVRQKLS